MKNTSHDGFDRLRVGISSCLLGEHVRFDGGHKRGELTSLIENYRLGLVPLIVPVTLIRHYVRKFEITYLVDSDLSGTSPA